MLKARKTAAEGRRFSNDVSRILCTLWVRIPVKYPLESLLLRPKIGGSNTFIATENRKEGERQKIYNSLWISRFAASVLTDLAAPFQYKKNCK